MLLTIVWVCCAVHVVRAADDGPPLSPVTGTSRPVTGTSLRTPPPVVSMLLKGPSSVSSSLFSEPYLVAQPQHDSTFPKLLAAEAKRSHPEFHHRLPPKELLYYFDTSIKEEVPEYDITTLRHVKGSRRRRGLTSAKEKLEYHVTAFGKDYQLQLHHNNNLMSAGCIVEQRLNRTTLVSPCFERGMDRDGLDNDCYYTGTSANHNGSTVAVSACNGLHGIISVSEYDHDLVIRPVKAEHSEDLRSIVRENLHVVFKRQTRQRRCGATGFDVPKEVNILRSGWSPGHQDGRISKRSSDDLYIEMLVVADKTLLDFHGTDLKNYLLTLTNVAAARMSDASLEHRVHIGVVKIQILDRDQPDLEIVEDALHGLKSFCDWQEKTNMPADENPQHYDAAVLFTRLDLTNKSGGRTTVGVATLGGMCVPNSRCLYVEDTGIDAGLTMAHEAGHSLGMEHDAVNNSCSDFTNMMSSGGATGPNSFQWSSCSKNALHAFIESGKSWCLEDKPTDEESLSKDLPGVLYDADDQCKMWAGTSYQEHADPCSQLWCRDPNNPGGVLKGSSPMMDGSMCGDRKYCINAQCLDIGADGPPAVDGGWSPWSAEWSDCSRTCGGGVRTRVRQCNNPKPRLGGDRCPGSSIKSVLCNIKPCSTTERKYKEEQCSATREQQVDGHLHDWIPWDVTGDQECYLLCKSQEDGRILRRTLDGSSNYRDGTSCSGTQTDQFYRCVQGSCQALSCDGHSDTGYKRDVCGVCGGSNDTCSRTTGSSNTRGEAQKWTAFVRFERGTSGVQLVNQNSLTKISLSVRGQLLFNADPTVSAPSGSYSLQGVTFTFTRAEGQHEEMLTINGPLQVDVEAQVYTLFDGAEFQPRVTYEFFVPLVNKTDHEWSAQVSSCSVQCGGGNYRMDITCTRKNDSQVVEDRLCDIYDKPDTTGSPCNTQACQSVWSAGSWGSCSGNCGEGNQTRQVDCVLQQSDQQVVAVDGDQCKDDLKPASSRPCHVTSCDAQWMTGNWSSCSLTCGRGVQSRYVVCVSDGKEIPESTCSGEKPATRQACVQAVCDTIRDDAGRSTDGQQCLDKIINCNEHGTGICTGQYAAWAADNCANFCGHCSSTETSSRHPPSTKPSSSCEDRTTDCTAYGHTICLGQYAAWARENCAKFCNYCGSSSSVQAASFSSSSFSPCMDKISTCSGHGQDVCTGMYSEWAKENCAKFCGYCETTSATAATPPSSLLSSQTSTSCEDKMSSCSAYGQSVCTGTYAEWAQVNCVKFCGLCRATTSSTVPTSASTSSLTSILSLSSSLGRTSTYASCGDKITYCSAYGQAVCAGDYADWAQENCANFCGLCRPTSSSTVPTYLSSSALPPQPSSSLLIDTTSTTFTDKSALCSEYGQDICTGNYAAWARENCAKLCGHVTIAVSSSSTSPSQPPLSASSSLLQVVTSTSCYNHYQSCSALGKGICIRQWAHENCAQFCGYCSLTPSSTLSTSLALSSSSSSSPPAPPPTLSAASLLLGNGKSATCDDQISYCGAYGQSVCAGDYAEWARQKCPKFCGHCAATSSPSSGACVDKVTNCAQYGVTVCTTFASWASENCQKMCRQC